MEQYSIYITKIDIIILLFWLVISISFVLNFGEYNSSKPINHFFAYSFVIIGNYFLLKNILTNLLIRKEASFDKLFHFIGISVLITSLFGLIEFFGKNIFSIEIDTYVPRAAAVDYDALASSFIRLRSFIEESGHLAFYYELMAPIGIYGLKKNKILFYATLLTTISCFILSFSTAGWIIVLAILITIFFVYLVKLLLQINLTFKIINLVKFSITSLFLIFSLIYLYQIIGSEIIENTIFDKINSSGSADDRTARAVDGINTFLNSNFFHVFIGYGPAVYDTLHFKDSTIILYQTFILENGVLGLSLFLIFNMIVIYQCILIQNRILKIIFISSIFAGLLHFIFISNYWYPWFWVIIILAQLYKQQKFNNEKEKSPIHSA